MKIKTFCSSSLKELEEQVNDFIKDKRVRDIKMNTEVKPLAFDRHDKLPTKFGCYKTILILYEEEYVTLK